MSTLLLSTSLCALAGDAVDVPKVLVSSEREKLLSLIIKAKEKGVGTKPYEDALAAIQTRLESGASNERSLKELTELTHKIRLQLAFLDSSNSGSTARDIAIELNNQGVQALSAGRESDAIAKLSESCDLDPDYELARENLAIAFNNRGIAFYKRKDYRSANADFEKSLFLRSERYVRFGNAVTCLHMGQFDDALEEAARLDSPELTGLALLGLNREDEAIGRVKRMKPPTLLALVVLSIAYRKKGNTSMAYSYEQKVSPKDRAELKNWQTVFKVQH